MREIGKTPCLNFAKHQLTVSQITCCFHFLQEDSSCPFSRENLKMRDSTSSVAVR